jgi:hypothetical protein
MVAAIGQIKHAEPTSVRSFALGSAAADLLERRAIVPKIQVLA